MACGRETAAILLEPIQGESGVRKFSSPDLRQIRELCDRLGLLLIFDEVQTGIGRTGHLFAYQAAGVVPDLLASAKGLGNGFPVAVCLASEGVAASMTPGTHGSTFGGNPLAMAVAARVIEIIANETFLNAVRHKGGKLRDGLQEIVAAYPNVFSEVRGEGLLLGLSCVPPAKAAVTATRANGLLTVTAGNNVMRLLPPLTVSEDEIATGLARLRRAAESLLSLQRVVGE